MTEEAETVCPKCGYHNQLGRSTCKNCGEALFAWAQTQVGKRKKPLRVRYDWLSVGLGLLFLVTIPLVIKYEARAISELSWYSLLILLLLISFLFAGIIWFLLPLYYLYVYLLGHKVTTGKMESGFVVGPDKDEPDYYIIVRFLPENARDSRPRLLTCKVAEGWSPKKEEILVSYALRNPNIVLLEGE